MNTHEHVDVEDRITWTFKAFSKTEKASLWQNNDYSNKTIICKAVNYIPTNLPTYNYKKYEDNNKKSENHPQVYWWGGSQ